ncbi:uracil-DNA glycosylase isoform X2 [Folsomia candida]|uniref:uracil-DNA glycosylase isoform X2 n=1 Tax=Folsomia candida TaxID=158441 RepID=UPI000B9002F5|nr:uracil-DNA glycosylase isoform X2 [Folsomia candida]
MQNTDQYKALLVKVQAKLTEFGMACTAWQWMIIHQFDQYRKSPVEGLTFLDKLLHEMDEKKTENLKPKNYFAFTKARNVRLQIGEVDVVIVEGDAPSPNLQKSRGYAFGTEEMASDSLKVLFQYMQQDLGITETIEPTGNLNGWIAQGVLLLNIFMSGHNDERYITEGIMRGVFRKNPSVIFLLFGKQANDTFKRAFKKQGKPRNFISMYHPNQGTVGGEGTNEEFAQNFYQKRPFTTANRWLLSFEKNEINWERFEIIDNEPEEEEQEEQELDWSDITE